eukprot:Colp12_sorted_trinity150504_noHs@9768
MASLRLLVLLAACSYAVAKTVPSFDQPPLIAPPVHVTQSGVGIYELQRLGHCMTTRWFQDEERQWLRLDEGFPEEEGFETSGQISCLTAEGSVIVTAGENGTMRCTNIPSFTYAMELEGYSEKHLDWTHNATINSASVMAYAGPAGDAVGTIHVIVYGETEYPHFFRGWDALGGGGTPGVSRHWYYDVTTESVFDSKPEIITNCAKLCGLSKAAAMEVLRNEDAPGFSDMRAKYCY